MLRVCYHCYISAYVEPLSHTCIVASFIVGDNIFFLCSERSEVFQVKMLVNNYVISDETVKFSRHSSHTLLRLWML